MIDFVARQNAYNRKSYYKHRTERLAHYAHYQQQTVKRQAFEAYSEGNPKCACCGELEFKFLALDHKNGGGNKERRALGITAGVRFYYWLKKSGYPPGYQILCHNCNCAKSYYKICPHQLLKQ